MAASTNDPVRFAAYDLRTGSSSLLATKLTAFDTYDEASRIAGGSLAPVDTITSEIDRAMIIGGRAVVWLTVPGHPEDARRLAPIVAARLNAAYG